MLANYRQILALMMGVVILGIALMPFSPIRAQNQSPATPPKNAGGQEDAARIKTMLKERRDILQEIVNALHQQYLSGQVDEGRILLASRELFQAELDLCDSPAERVALYEKRVRTLKDYEKMSQERLKAGRISQADFLECKAQRLEGEIELERERIKAKPSSK
ncbi:MAG: hypothetical protein JO112_17980 [Planctomycetes bacterium]|nr:hypothetical protein [Planctomycetota bacterium]